MGKKNGGRPSSSSSSSNAGDAAAPKPTAFVLKVPTHCRCDGCDDKVRAAVKDLTLRCEGILSLDTSALRTKGELAVVATADPERLRRRLRKATGKDVGLVFPKPPAASAKENGGGKDDAAAVQALLAGLQLPQQPVYGHHGHPVPAAGAWYALQHGGYGQPAYPWVLQQQQAPPGEPYFASYTRAAYPAAAAASWGAYAAYPHGGGGWLGY